MPAAARFLTREVGLAFDWRAKKVHRHGVDRYTSDIKRPGCGRGKATVARKVLLPIDA